MQRYILAYFVILSLLLSSCASSVKVTGGNSSGTTTTTTTTTQSPSKKNEKVVNEDLSQYRPRYQSSNSAVIPSEKTVTMPSSTVTDAPLHVNKRLDAVLDTIAIRNKSIKFTDDAKIYTYQKYPEIFPYLSYQQPIYKVKIGDFLNRMDAERYFADIKELYPSAMILPDRVEIKKGMMVSK
jgi:hypothetical protein